MWLNGCLADVCVEAVSGGGVAYLELNKGRFCWSDLTNRVDGLSLSKRACISISIGSCNVISLTTEYALRAVVWLAANPNRSMTAREIAETIGVPGGYLAKVLQGLGRAGILHSQRGLGGGFTLTRAPSTLTLWDIVEAVDPVRRIKGCPAADGAVNDELCPLHRQIDNAVAAAAKTLSSCKLSKLIDGTGKVPPVCGTVTKSKTATKSGAKLGRRPKR